MIEVTVYLHTILQQPSSAGLRHRFELALPEGATLETARQAMQVGLAVEHMLLVVNGSTVELTHPLHSGDEVHFIPALEGG